MDQRETGCYKIIRNPMLIQEQPSALIFGIVTTNKHYEYLLLAKKEGGLLTEMTLMLTIDSIKLILNNSSEKIYSDWFEKSKTQILLTLSFAFALENSKTIMCLSFLIK